MSRGRFLKILIWLLIGFFTGAAIGLYLGWIAWPLEVTEADPGALEEHFQMDYTLMIATAYSNDQDLSMARKRLDDLVKDDVENWVLNITVDHILNGESEEDILRLVNLTRDLGEHSPIIEPYLQLLEAEQEP